MKKLHMKPLLAALSLGVTGAGADATLDGPYDLFNHPFFKQAQGQMTSSRVQSTVSETKEGYEIQVSLPGFKKDQIGVEVRHDGSIQVIAKASKKTEEKKLIHGQSLHIQDVREVYNLGPSADVNSLKAKLENGILTLTLKHNKNHCQKKVIKID